MGSIKWV